MSYDLTVYRVGKRVPRTLEEIDREALPPMGSYAEVKRLLDSHCSGIVWRDQRQSGRLENEIGRFYFLCDEEQLKLGSFGVGISSGQDLEAGLAFLEKILKSAGLFASDDQSLEIIGGGMRSSPRLPPLSTPGVRPQPRVPRPDFIRPSRQTLVASWLLLVAGIGVSVVSAFGWLMIGLVAVLRRDYLDKQAWSEMQARFPFLAAAGSINAVGSILLLLAGTLLYEPTLVSAMGMSAVLIVLWPILLMLCLNDFHLFRHAE